MRDDIDIRVATVSDAPALLGIYAPYVADTAITFEYEVPSLGAFSQRIATTLDRYPYLVAETDGRVVGYAYAGAFKGRPAYDWSAEATVYVDTGCHGRGIGSALYRKLEALLKRQGVRNLYACITYPNIPSEAFHERLGFSTVGRFSQCGYKFGKWRDMIWMEKMIGEHDGEVSPIVPFPALEFSE